MISTDEHPPPDPTSSHYQYQQLVSHEAPASLSDIDLLKPLDDANLDDTNSLPNFSIRDYVFGSRCKDIAGSWPFSTESLQLCLDNGVKNLLPPFQSLDSLRTHSSVSRCAVKNHLANEETIISNQFVSVTSSQCHIEEDLAHNKSSKSLAGSTNSQPAVKKCKLVMKLNPGVEEVTMTCKICPVCKTFSSSSNTTLNAHIDQCLSEESSMKSTAKLPNITVKHKIKPRKMRSMVDIYKTAPRCTIEELDRRNGTNWATNSSFPDQELELQAEEKKEEAATVIPEVADHEGAVYIDTNGTKVRILSLMSHEAQESQKGRKGCKAVTEKKKKKKKKVNGQKNHRKMLKVSPNNKKISSLKAHHGASKETGGEEEEKVMIEESCNKEDGDENPMKGQVDYKQMDDDLVITRPPWACCKRTGRAKNLNGKLVVESDRSSGCGSKTIPASSSDHNISSSQYSSRKATPLEGSVLKKNILSESREHIIAGSKINLKRKISARDHCLSMENAVTGPSKDSWKHKSRVDEDKKKKKKKSVTSKSSNGDSSSIGGLEITSESARTEVPLQPDHVHGSFMGLRNSLDDEFYNKFDSQELYQGRLCSPNHTLDDIMIGRTTEDHLDGTEKKQENYSQKVDPIPIPGPPGSFLPLSPGADMVSEELQGNSSLTVQSSEDQHHHHHHDNMMMNMDFISDSPISTVSSPSFVRSGSRTCDNKLSAIFTEKGPTPFDFMKDQPCCCSRKEGVLSKNVASYHQQSAILREQALESNRWRPNCMNLRSELINHPTLPPAETVKSPPAADALLRLPVYRHCESAGSPTTPVLRLMGKNLTVVKTDDDDHHFRPSPMGHQQPSNIQNNYHNSFYYGYPPQHNMIFSHDPYPPQRSDVNPPNNFRSLAAVDLRPVHAFDTMFPISTTKDTKVAYDDGNMVNPVLKATKDTILIDDDSSENEAEDPYVNFLGNGINDGNHDDVGRGRWGCTETGSSSSSSMLLHTRTYYPHG